MSSVRGIVNIQFPLLFIVLKQLLVLVSYANTVWILLSDFLRHNVFPFLLFFKILGFFLTQLDLHYKFELTILRENSLNILSAFYGFLCRNV